AAESAYPRLEGSARIRPAKGETMTAMSFGRSVGVLSLALAGFVACTVARAQPALPPLDAAARRAAVESAATAFRSRYVSPEIGERAAAAIEAALAKGEYDALTERQAFAEKLTADLRAVTADQHVQVFGAGPPAGAPPAPPPRSEGGVTRADRLPGNIGYIEIVALGPPALFNSAVDRSMAALKDTTALIVDARGAQGGLLPSVAYFVSYFVSGEKPVHISDTIARTPDTQTFRTSELWSVSTPFSYDNPVYVLTSGRTLSAGEAFAYDLQAMKRATLVGETTSGAANAAGMALLGPGLSMMLSGARLQNAVTGTNWEGVGVKPDVAAPSADALEVALERLGRSPPAASEIDALSEARVFTPRSAQQPGAEAAVRRMSEENRRGEPNYDLLSPELGEATRRQLDGLKKTFSDLGPLESVKFVEVNPQGADTYEVHYANGAALWTILLDADGKTVMAGVRPLQTSQ
ncbi:MAG TPA: S41 family peptidase, partial [Gammaproteobacteria bacterium]|nr:S41 family peptidase [Gammaproteobacteria bacterium]